MLTYLLIFIISFSLMYTISYGYYTTIQVLAILPLFDVDWREEGTWNPVGYMLSLFIFSTLLMPIFLWQMLTNDRKEIIKAEVGEILEHHFGFEKE